MGYSRIFLESGVNLTSNFLKKNLVNDLSLFISKYKIGTFGLKKFKINNYISKKKSSSKEKVNLFGDQFISYNIK